jgi:hypothetical protein
VSRKSKTFTVVDGMQLQQVNLYRWKQMLNKKTYDLLVGEVEKLNRLLTDECDGHDVCRGDALTTIILNLNLNSTKQ